MPNEMYTEKIFLKKDRTWLRNKTITHEAKKEKRNGKSRVGPGLWVSKQAVVAENLAPMVTRTESPT